MAIAEKEQYNKENSPSKSSRGGGSFFKKRTARRAKSLNKDHWDDVIFGKHRKAPVLKLLSSEKKCVLNLRDKLYV